MNPKKAYKFCPKCGGKFTPQKNNLLKCGQCLFHFYINPMPTNGVIIENDRSEILLVKRAFPPQKGCWDVPGGFIQPRESFAYSVMRELKEELNVDVKINRVIGVYTDTYLYEGVINDILCIMVSAVIIKGDLRPGDDAETYEFFPKQTILKQQIAFEGVRKSLKDYIRPATSLPNLTL